MGTQIQISKYAWPVTGVVVILVIGAIIYFVMGKYDHISKSQFFGPGKCKECHKEQYDSWKKTKMANSFNALRPGIKAGRNKWQGSIRTRTTHMMKFACLVIPRDTVWSAVSSQ
jgi:hypothetical protein